MHLSLKQAVIISFLLCADFMHAQTSTASQSSSYRIAGAAVNAITGAPLAHARVTLGDALDPDQSISAVTSDDGRFTFIQVARGKFSLRGEKRGFISAAYLEHDQFSSAIVTGAGVDTEHLVLKLAPLAIISGRVLDEAGEPVQHAAVGLYRENHRMGESRITRLRGGPTDDQGYYEFNNLEAGTYFVSVRAKPWYAVYSPQQKGNANPTSSVDPSLDVAYPITYYGDTSDPDEATAIPIKGGDHPEVDIHLNPVAALHVQYQSPGDQTRGFAAPSLKIPSFDGMENVNNIVTHPISGSVFELTGIAPGHYIVSMPPAPGQGGPTNEVAVDLTGGNQQLDAASGETSSRVKAVVQVSGESAPPEHLLLVLRNSKLRNVGRDEINEKGEVTFDNIAAGRYELIAQGPGRRYSVARISSKSGQIQGHYLDLAAGSNISVSVLLVAGAVHVDGFVQRAGKPVAGAMIVLAPSDPESNRPLFRRDQSDLDGSFKLPSVIPGTYSVCAIEDGWDLDWAKPAVIAHYCEHGQKLTIPSGAQGSLQLPAPVEVQSR